MEDEKCLDGWCCRCTGYDNQCCKCGATLEPLPPRVLAAEQRRETRYRLERGSLGCPAPPPGCGHLLVDHGDNWDRKGQPLNPQCRKCDCEGK